MGAAGGRRPPILLQEPPPRQAPEGTPTIPVTPAAARRKRSPALPRQMLAIQSISTSELPGIPPAAAIVVRTPGSGPKRPRNTSFIAA